MKWMRNVKVVMSVFLVIAALLYGYTQHELKLALVFCIFVVVIAFLFWDGLTGVMPDDFDNK